MGRSGRFSADRPTVYDPAVPAGAIRQRPHFARLYRDVIGLIAGLVSGALLAGTVRRRRATSHPVATPSGRG